MYKYLNMNPKGKKTSDCVVRAMMLATGKTWEEVMTDLFNIALKVKSMPNDVTVYSKYAKQLGFEECKVLPIGGHKPSVKEFCNLHKEGTYVLRIANHIVTVKDGCYYDIWDCGNKKIYKFWKVI